MEATDLPLAAPKILDQQRTRVQKALASVESTLVPADRVRDLVRAATLESEGTPLEVVLLPKGRPDHHGYWRPGQLLVREEGMTEVQILHHVAHHLTSDVFPPHGAEFVQILVELVDSAAPHLSKKLRWALGREDVIGVPDGQPARTKLERWSRRHPGCLVKVVLAGPPKRVVGLLEEATDEEVRLVTGRGPESYSVDRVRYCSRKT